MSWVRIWVHIVFATKNRMPRIEKSFRNDLFTHIKDNAARKNLRLSEVNGHKDHVHCLLALNKDISIAKTVQLIKGESAHWINNNKLCSEKFTWQDDYWAVGVSESHLNSVKNYIKKQELHHEESSFQEEVDNFIEKYGWT